MYNFQKTLIVLIVLLVVSQIGLFLLAFALPIKGPVHLNIAYGQSLKAIVSSFEDSFATPRLFIFYTRLLGQDKRIVAGTYSFEEGTLGASILYRLIKGQTEITTLMIPEGLTSEEILSLLKKSPFLRQDTPPAFAEGSLLPETYYVEHQTPISSVITRLKTAQEEFLKTAWENRNKEALSDLITTPQEAVILASLVEKETAREHERYRIAGVFYNRLRKGMLLQSDPSVLYKEQPPLTKKKLKTPHPFNTYMFKGLPPGAICHPGKASIKAVLQPAKTKAFYFVADKKGGHLFSETLKDHINNIRTLRK